MSQIEETLLAQNAKDFKGRTPLELGVIAKEHEANKKEKEHNANQLLWIINIESKS